MNILNKLYAFLSSRYKSLKQENAIKREQNAILEATRTLQVLEFSGELYLSYRGVPIINQALLKKTLPETLEESRNTLCKWNNINNK